MTNPTPPQDWADTANCLKHLETQTGSLNTPAGKARALAVLSGYKLPRPIPHGEMARLLDGVKLPKPLELATLAATVGPRDKPDEAIHTALCFYLRATLFLKQHQNDSLADLALSVEDYDLFLGAYAHRSLGPYTSLEMDKPRDAARKHLASLKCKWGKTARNLKDNLCAYLKYADMLDFLYRAKKQRPEFSDSMTEKDKNKAIDQQARQAGWNKSDAQLLAKFREERTDNREVYLIPQAILASLAEWKRKIKSSGGHKSRTTAQGASKNKSPGKSLTAP